MTARQGEGVQIKVLAFACVRMEEQELTERKIHA